MRYRTYRVVKVNVVHRILIWLGLASQPIEEVDVLSWCGVNEDKKEE